MGLSKAGFELGWRAYDQAQQDKYRRERDEKADARLAEADKRASEEFAWRREEVERAREDRKKLEELMSRGFGDFTHADLPDYAPVVPRGLGNPADMAAGSVPGMARAGAGLPMPAQGAIQADAAAPKVPQARVNPLAAQRAQLLEEAEMYRAMRRPDLWANVRRNINTLDNQARQAQLTDWIMKAPDPDLDKLHSQVTMDPQNQFKMVRDPKTGYTTISEGEMNVKLTRPQLATYFGGLMAIRQGDADGGLKQIASVSSALAAKAKEQLDAFRVMAQVNNPANHQAKTDEISMMNARTNASRVGLESAQLKKFNELERLSHEYVEADEAYRNAVTQHGANSPATKAYKQRRDQIEMRRSIMSGKPAEDPRRTVAGYADEIYRTALKESTDPVAAARSRDAYLASNGVAPQEALARLQSGKNPDGTAMTEDDITKFNAEFYNSPVDPAAVLKAWAPRAAAPARGLPPPTVAKAAPEPANPWMQRRQQVLEADRLARAARDEAERREQAARYEADRQAALAARPWLSQMGSKFQ